MPANYVLLEKIVVGAAGASSIAFNSIPQSGYTDLKLVWSSRATQTGTDSAAQYISFNGLTTNFSFKRLRGTGTAADSYGESTNGVYGTADAAGATASTFSNGEIYIPNYTSSNYKSWSVDSATENNATSAIAVMFAGLWSNTAAITSIGFTTDGTYVQYSTFSLYGVAALNTTPAIAPKATGGDVIMSDGTYWYHAFRSSGTFTPSVALSCNVLAIAGGGSGGANNGGGGGAGGVYSATTSVATAQTVTVGAGGAQVVTNVVGNNGSNSVFGSLTAAVGGGGGGHQLTQDGNTGGSGGGSSFARSSGAAGTSGQGNAGGGGNTTTGFPGGGGGGAGAAGGNGSANTGGTGGTATTAYSSWATATGTGVSNNYAGGGGGGNAVNGGSRSSGGGAGAGTGGTGTGTSDSNGSNATANTGSGGGGGGSNATNYGGAGGSGIVIVRYTIA